MKVLLGFQTLLACVRLCAAREKSYTVDATRLRQDLLHGPDIYDRLAPPTSDRTVNYSKAGTDVAFSIRFFKVQAVDASKGHMRLKVWVRFQWVDQRLSWNPADYGNITEIVVDGGGSTDRENSEVWLPDIQMYNSNVGVQATLDKVNPNLYSDGTLLWSRPGILDAMCKFSGLVAFPFDKLKCVMEWGGWAYGDAFQAITLMGTGVEFASESTSGSSYQEYAIDDVKVETHTTIYPLVPDSPWTLAKVTVELHRAHYYYVVFIIVPTIMITYLSFGVFFLSHKVGERLSFGITLVLVVEVMRTTVANFVPVCGELLWVDVFMMVNTMYSFMSLLETMLVLFLAFNTSQGPQFLSFLSWGPKGLSMPFQSEAGTIYRRLTGVLTPAKRQSLSDIKSISETDTAKLIFFENLFYMLDSDAHGLISLEDACCMLSYVNLERSRKSLEEFVQEQWPGQTRFNCSSFLEICIELMWMKPFQEIKMGAENYSSSYSRREKLCANYWLHWSKRIDRWSRLAFPVLYTSTLAVLANLEFTDDYLDQGEGMFQGIGPIGMDAMAVLRSLITPSICLVASLAYFYLKKLSERKTLAQIQPVEERGKPVVPRWSVKMMPDIENEAKELS